MSEQDANNCEHDMKPRMTCDVYDCAMCGCVFTAKDLLVRTATTPDDIARWSSLRRMPTTPPVAVLLRGHRP